MPNFNFPLTHQVFKKSLTIIQSIWDSFWMSNHFLSDYQVEIVSNFLHFLGDTFHYWTNVYENQPRKFPVVHRRNSGYWSLKLHCNWQLDNSSVWALVDSWTGCLLCHSCWCIGSSQQFYYSPFGIQSFGIWSCEVVHSLYRPNFQHNLLSYWDLHRWEHHFG